MAADNSRVAINELRYPVILARRDQLPDDYASIDEELANAIRVHAKIEDLYPQTYWGIAAQTDRPVTHMIWIRWLGWIDTTHVIIRHTRLPNQELRTDLFRIRRVKEMNGRKRFLEMECELEHREAM